MPRKNKNIWKSRQSDPHRAREAKKYDRPVPSREFILTALGEHGAPLRAEELAALFEITHEQELEGLSRRLSAMRRDGQVLVNRKGGFFPVNHEDVITGRVIAHPDGFGFLQSDAGGDDLFLPPSAMRGLWHGDRIVARVAGFDRRGRTEAAVVEVLERGVKRLVGRVQIEAGVAFLIPDNRRHLHDVLLPNDQLAGAQNGQIAEVELTEQPGKVRKPIGRVVGVLGDQMAPGMATDIALRSFDIPEQWPEAVEAEIARLGAEVPESAKTDRVDLRDLPLVTIDGADARDFDDAVYCARTPKGWRLLVAIADVSHYVRPGTALDTEAQRRGTSVYFPDRVVPMLPEILSNGLCSLKPNVDRLCMVAELYVDAAGEVSRTRFFPAVMHSHARLTYDEVHAALEGEGEVCTRHADLLPHLHELYALFQALRQARTRRGAIDFDTTEARFVLSDDGAVQDIVPLLRHDAHRLIEECMIAANVAAAKQLLRRKIPALYRIHERPGLEKLSDLREFLRELGLQLPGGAEPHAKDYADLLERVRDRTDAHMIQTVLLRSMMQAVYAADNSGHFGLALSAYTHFTSPIRRYPDLIVHRALRHAVAGGKAADFMYSPADLVTQGEHCSMAERRADEATRDVTDVLKCAYMADKLGEIYGGVITTVTGFGVFVELDNFYVTGLVHITALDHDYFHFDAIAHTLKGERTGKTYRLGDAIRVRVAAVNVEDRKIDLVLADAAGSGGRRPPKARKKSRRGRR